MRYRLETQPLIDDHSSSTYHYFSDSDYDPDWSDPDFPDSHWAQGGQGLGYDSSFVFMPYIHTELTDMRFHHRGVYVRYPFILNESQSVAELTLQLRIDDGCVVFLNGHEVYRQHAPLYDLGPLSLALRTADESLLESPSLIDLTPFRSRLRSGENVLAIHGLNHSLASSDILVQAKLTAEVGAPSPPRYNSR